MTVISEQSNKLLRNLQKTSLEIFTNCVCPIPSEQPQWFRSPLRAEVLQEDLLQTSISRVLCCDCEKHLQRAAFICFPPPQQTALLYWRLTLVALFRMRRLVREPSIGPDSSALHFLCQQGEILWVSSQKRKFPHDKMPFSAAFVGHHLHSARSTQPLAYEEACFQNVFSALIALKNGCF